MMSTNGPPFFDPLRFVRRAPPVNTPSQDRQRLIAEIAYFKAQSRGFEPGHEEEDWHAAEMEVDSAV
jgi:Protein of unknown function (DUF2934)